MTWWNRKSKPDDEPEFCPFSGRSEGPRGIDTKILYESSTPIRGDEPFLDYVRSSMIINLRSYDGRSHNFFESSSNGWGGIPLHYLHRGDKFRVQLSRVREVDIPWYEAKLRALLEWLEKRRKK